MKFTRKNRVGLDQGESKNFRVRNRALLQLSRWLVLAVCWCSGGFLVFGGRSIGLVPMLVGVWLIFDNPLEHFATLEGSCPSCGEAVAIRKQARFRCPECGTQIVAARDSFHDADQNVFADPSLLSPGGSLPTASEGEPVVIRPGDTLDLHSFSPKEVPSLLAEFIRLCQASDIRLATIIHGKGTGALRRRVRGLLARDPRVEAFYDAPPKSGGWGATLVELRSGRGEANGESQDGDT